jgi:hypothetical protein
MYLNSKIHHVLKKKKWRSQTVSYKKVLYLWIIEFSAFSEWTYSDANSATLRATSNSATGRISIHFFGPQLLSFRCVLQSLRSVLRINRFFLLHSDNIIVTYSSFIFANIFGKCLNIRNSRICVEVFVSYFFVCTKYSRNKNLRAFRIACHTLPHIEDLPILIGTLGCSLTSVDI